MGRKYFIRKSSEDLLSEQNALLKKLKEKQEELNRRLQQGDHKIVTESAEPLVEDEPLFEEIEDDLPLIEEDGTFIPSADLKGKVDLAHINTTESSVDNDSVEKLRRGRGRPKGSKNKKTSKSAAKSK